MKNGIIFILTILFVSCASTSYNIKVNSIGNNGEYSKNYIIIPSENVSKNELLFNEIRGYTIKILESKGYQLMDNAHEADIIILLDYKIDYRGMKKIVDSDMALINAMENYARSYRGQDALSSGTKMIEEYSRSIDIIAFDLQLLLRTEEIKSIWHTSAVSIGSSSDLRKIVPYMLIAMKDYLGTNTKGDINLDLYEDTPEVNDLIE
jgi:hypothetical protein